MSKIWGSDTTYGAGKPYPSANVKEEPSAAELASGQVAGESIKVQPLNWILNWLSSQSALMNGLWGDASDGNHTVSGTETLTTSPKYDLLTIPTGQTLKANNWLVRAREVVVESSAYLTSDGLPGADSSTTSGGGQTNAPVGTHQYGRAGYGGAGGADDNNGAAGEGVFGFGGNGGAGADSAPATGGAAGAVTNDPIGGEPFPAPRAIPDALGALVGSDGSIYHFAGGGGGGGGAGEGTGAVAAGGGGGGTGGGVLVIVCDKLTNDGVISALGGDGGDSITHGGGPGGGGGGGGGGLVIIIANEIEGAGVVDVSGGAGGAGATAGAAGSTGNIWYLIGQP